MVSTSSSTQLLFFAVLIIASLFINPSSASLSTSGSSNACQQEIAAMPSDWSEQEREAWKEICKGNTADLKMCLLQNSPDARHDLDNDCRKISASFLKTILLSEQYWKSIPGRAVKIKNAIFYEELDFSNSTIGVELWLDDSHFQEPVIFLTSDFQKDVTFDGSQFDKLLDLRSINASSELAIRDAKLSVVDLTGTRVLGPLNLSGSYASGPIAMDYIEVGQSLDMSTGNFTSVSLLDATVKGAVTFSGAHFSGTLDMESIEIGSNLFLDRLDEKQSLFRDIKLIDANISGNISMIGANISGFLNMDSVRIGRHLLMCSKMKFDSTECLDRSYSGDEVEALTEFNNVHIGSSNVGGHIHLAGAEIAGGLGIAYANVRGSLLAYALSVEKEASLSFSTFNSIQFANNHSNVSWGENASLKLKRTRSDYIKLSNVSLPVDTDLEGLIYKDLIIREFEDENVSDFKKVKWYKEYWLEKGRYNSQKYKLLSDVIEQNGNPRLANEIRYLNKKKIHQMSNGYTWASLSLQKILIGYGYRIRWAAIWIVAFTVLGAIVHHLSLKNQSKSIPSNIFFSFDLLLPILKLDKKHYELEIAGTARYYFAAHQIIGFILVSFILAGLAGLTE